MLYPAPPMRYFPQEYLASRKHIERTNGSFFSSLALSVFAEGNPQSMQLQQIPIYYSMNAAGMIQSAGTVGQPQNIMIPTGSSTGGPPTSAASPLYYTGLYPGKWTRKIIQFLVESIFCLDPRMYSLYSSAAAMNPQWQLARSPPQQQQQQQQQQPQQQQQQQQPQQQQSADQQRGYPGGQNPGSQQASSAGVANPSNNNSRSAPTSGPPSAGATGPPMTPQYAMNGGVPAGYTYGTAATWLPGHQQIPSPQTNMPGQVNTGYNIMFDPSQQQVAPQQATYVHPSAYDAAAYYSQQQASSQPSLDAAPQGNYSR